MGEDATATVHILDISENFPTIDVKRLWLFDTYGQTATNGTGDQARED